MHTILFICKIAYFFTLKHTQLTRETHTRDIIIIRIFFYLLLQICWVYSIFFFEMKQTIFFESTVECIQKCNQRDCTKNYLFCSLWIGFGMIIFVSIITVVSFFLILRNNESENKNLSAKLWSDVGIFFWRNLEREKIEKMFHFHSYCIPRKKQYIFPLLLSFFLFVVEFHLFLCCFPYHYFDVINTHNHTQYFLECLNALVIRSCSLFTEIYEKCNAAA